MENKMDFRAETVAEEYAEMVGRLKAFEAFLNVDASDYVEKDICAAMLGMNNSEDEE
jgi:small nuclear ribonucleoprotein (snRNP)-like protein